MDEETLKEAMRFGSDVSQEVDRLGKFGLGLKLASLSQARELRVISNASGQTNGRGWLEEGISKGFSSTVFDSAECKTMLKAVAPDKPWRKSGTLVWWSDLYRVGQNHADPDAHAQKLLRGLKDNLSLSFHRFLAGKPRKIQISIDIFDGDSSLDGLPLQLEPLNPFGYQESGRKEFPAELTAADGFAGKIKIKAHIWPPKLSAPEYNLPGGTNSRQGFYFYRNNRLIQGGGWNGTRENEPHSSLARLEIDMNPDFDLAVSLDVKKVTIQLPPALVAAIANSKTASGLSYKKYLSIADETYRTKPITDDELPLIPADGMPADLRDFLLEELKIDGTNKYRKLKFVWSPLDKGVFFELDREIDTIRLNKSYRRQLLHGLPSSSTDVPVFKCLLFLALRYALSSQRMSSKVREQTEQTNRILVRALKYERQLE